MRECSVPECCSRHRAKGYCYRHWKRMYRYGRTENLTQVQMFESHLSHQDQNECWVWDKPSQNDGYGQFFGPAHRWSYEYHIGPIPDGLHIDHLCRNRACVNPWHLEPVHLTENVMRGEGYYAINARKTHCLRGHEFSPSNTYTTPDGRRQCRKCAAVREANRKATAVAQHRS